MPASRDLIDELCRRHQAAKSERTTLDSTWERVAELYRPERTGFTSAQTPGQDRIREVYDGEQMDAADELARSMDYMLTPKGDAWVAVSTEDDGEAEDDDVTLWLEEASKTLLSRMYDPAAGLETMLQIAYRDVVTFGAAVAQVIEPKPGAFLFRPYHLKDVHWLRDYAGRPDTVFVTCEMTARQARQKGWLSRKVNEALQQDKLDEKFTFLEVTAPRVDFRPGSPLSTDMPWAYHVIEMAEKEAVAEGGYNENPWLIPEWEVLANGDVWSPARRALPDVRTLQQVAKTLIRQGQLAAEPPILVASDGIMGPLRRNPGAVSAFDAQNVPPNGKLVEVLNLTGELAVNFDMLEALRQKIRRAFMLDVIRLPDKSGMSATEVLRHNRDFVRLTTSPFGRFEMGLTQPLVERCFAILFRQSMALRFGEGSPFPPVPAGIQGNSVKFKFFTEVARARQASETAGIATTFEALMPLAQAVPGILDHLDADELARDVIGNQLSARYVKPRDQVAKDRKERADAIEEQAQAELAVQQSQAVKNASQAAQPFMQQGQTA